MARSVKKGPYVDHNLQGKLDKMNVEGAKKAVIKTWSRRSYDYTRICWSYISQYIMEINLFQFMLVKIW